MQYIYYYGKIVVAAATDPNTDMHTEYELKYTHNNIERRPVCTLVPCVNAYCL